MAKIRTDIPKDTAAIVLFLSDRACCICHDKDKIQIHHIDDDPSNHNIDNLSVLCFRCHDDTLIQGGYARKLTAEQVILYRDDWLRQVAKCRGTTEDKEGRKQSVSMDLAMALNLVEIFKHNDQVALLAMFYNSIGYPELRNIYVEEAIKHKIDDSTLIFLRCLQKKPEVIPKDVIIRETKRLKDAEDYHDLARLYYDLGEYKKSALYYAMTSIQSIETEDNAFGAAFYIKQAQQLGIANKLFEIALKDAMKDNDLWWQVRSLQELERKDDLKELLNQHRSKINKSNNNELKMILAEMDGNKELFMKHQKKFAVSISAHDIYSARCKLQDHMISK